MHTVQLLVRIITRIRWDKVSPLNLFLLHLTKYRSTGRFGLEGDARIRGVSWPRNRSVWVGPPRFSRTGLFSKAGRKLGAHCANWVQFSHMRCLCGISRFFFCQITDEKKSTFELTFHHDDDYQFALTVQESIQTLPPRFNVEEFERSQPIVGGQIYQSEFCTVSEQLL